MWFFIKLKKTRAYYISDPAHGLLEYNEKEFLKFWIGNNADEIQKKVLLYY